MVSQQGHLGTWSEFLPPGQEWLRAAWTAWREMLPQQPERPVQELLSEEGPAPMLLTQQRRGKARQRLLLLETFPSSVEGPSS